MSPQEAVEAAYRAYMKHCGHNDTGVRCQRCVDNSKAPTQGCPEGRRLWGLYRLATIASSLPSR